MHPATSNISGLIKRCCKLFDNAPSGIPQEYRDKFQECKRRIEAFVKKGKMAVDTETGRLVSALLEDIQASIDSFCTNLFCSNYCFLFANQRDFSKDIEHERRGDARGSHALAPKSGKEIEHE